MAFRLEKQESVAAGIRRVALECVDAIEQQLTDEAVDRDKAVHNARKSCKRLRAVLRLVRDEIGSDVFRQENICFRDVSRQLGVARDSYVLIETLDALDRQFPNVLPDQLIAGVHVQLEERYQIVLHRLLAEDSVIEAVLHKIRAARPRIESLPIVGDDFGVFARSLRRVYRRGRRAMTAAYVRDSDPHAFHEWRKRVKYLWYQMEILQDVWSPLVLDFADQLHALSGYLGDDHDLAELRHVLLHHPEKFGGEPNLSVLLEIIAQRRVELETAAHPLGQRIFMERPGVFVARMNAYWQAWQSETGPALQTVSDSQDMGQEVLSVQDRLLTTRQAAEWADMPIGQIRSLIYSGALPAFKLGRNWVIERAAIESLAAQIGST